MKYATPVNASHDNDHYVDANPAMGIEGSIISATAIEPTMREIVNAITAAGLTPSKDDMMQLAQAIEIISKQLASVSTQGTVYLADGINDTRSNAVPSATDVRKALITAPIGMTYIQFTAMPTPADLFGGTWNNISSNFAGHFFRAEGGAAATFGSVQADATRNATGQFSFRDDNDGAIRPHVDVATGVFQAVYTNHRTESVGGGTGSQNIPHYVGFDLSRALPNNIANEVRPINSTIRIWQRIA